MKRKNILSIIAGSLLILNSSCTDYLDVSKEVHENLTTQDVFNNPNYLKRWYSEIYTTIPNYSQHGYYATDGLTGAWNILAGELTYGDPIVPRSQAVSGYNSLSAGLQRWDKCYKSIRQALIFLENAPESLGAPTEPTSIPKEEMDRMKAEVKYLLAYNYFLLFELYGPVPIVEEVANPEADSWDIPRASLDDLLAYMDGLLQEIIEGDDLPNTIRTTTGGNDYEHNNDMYNLKEIVRPTKVAAMALRARLWVYAASPLFNGRYEEALKLTNPDGTRIFPDYNPEKWETAKIHLETLLAFCNANGLHLYQAAPDTEGNVDPNQSIYELYQYYNDEIIWATGNNDYRSIGYDGDMECFTTPRDVYNRIGGVGIFQEIIDAFFMKNGLCINDDNSGYAEDGFVDFPNVCNEDKYLDKHVFNMYANREPRFYAAVTYQGKSWHRQPFDRPNYSVCYFLGSGNDNVSGGGMHPRTGYGLYKFNNRQLLRFGNEVQTWGRPWILFRLADFYLYYAEVCNEIDPSDENIIRYLDLVRERAGIPGYRELANQGLKNIIGDQEAQREAIQHERRIELFAEGNYYFDIHRWMTCGYSAEQQDNESKIISFTGMNMNVKAADIDPNTKLPIRWYDDIGEGSYYDRVVIDRFTWEKSMLLYPIPYNEIQNCTMLVQNPLWN